MDDMELLREYVAQGSDAAFEAILNRHINLVYSTAMRQVRDPVLAGEVTQTTFIILARKARGLGSGTILSGWLYRTTQFAAARALRTEARRRDREREAAHMQTEQTDTVWEHLAPILDQAMDQLGANDRNAVVLRYFENKNSREVGAALGINEAAAQKRVARAVEKLRGFCTKRGVVVPVIALTALISSNAVQAAPVGAVAATTTVLKGATLSASTAALVNGTLDLIAWAKFKIAALAGLGVIAVAGVAVLIEAPRWSQPAYQSRSISSWLGQLDDGHRELSVELRWEPWQTAVHRSPKQAQAAQAVRAMGTNAFPYLLAALEKKDSRFERLLGKFGTPPEAARRQAALALDSFGPECKPLIPELTRILHGDRSPKEAAIGLAAIGPEGWEVLTLSIPDTNRVASLCSIWALGSHRGAVPGTVEALKASFADEPAGETAISAWALAEIGQDREQVVSLLIGGLQFRRIDSKWGCAVALGRLGPDARSAVPALLALLHNTHPIIHHDAAQALEQIDPQAAARAGVTGALATEHIPRTVPFP